MKIQYALAGVLLLNCSHLPRIDHTECLLVIATSTPSYVSVGELVTMELTLSNQCRTATYVELNPDDVHLRISSGETDFIAPVPHATRLREPEVDYVMIAPKGETSWSLPASLNDIEYPEAIIFEPGSYTIRTIFESQGPQTWRGMPVWRGKVVSSVTEVTVGEPSSGQLGIWQLRAASCRSDPECDGIEVANFYRVIREPAVADDLIGILEARPYLSWVIEAVVNQGRPEDADSLTRIAGDLKASNLRDMLLEAAATLRNLRY